MLAPTREHDREFIPTRRSLLTRLKRWDDQESWRDFFNTYWKLIYSVALKAGLYETEAQEVVQETVISVAKKMPGFKYDPAVGSFKSWLLLVTRRRIADQFRKRPRETSFPAAPPGQTSRTSPSARIPDPESLDVNKVWDEEWQRNLLDAALTNVKAKVAPRQYQIFELYVLKQWPVERLTTTLAVSAGQVYLAKLRVGNLVKKELKRLEAAKTW
jgi:RNA polymerase sigma-70 factor (ECF subfamily)